MQLSQLVMEGPKKVKEREQMFGGGGFMRYGHDQGGGNDEDEDEIESVKGERATTRRAPMHNSKECTRDAMHARSGDHESHL